MTSVMIPASTPRRTGTGTRRLTRPPSGAPVSEPSTTVSAGHSGTWPVSALPRKPVTAEMPTMASEVPMLSRIGTRSTPTSTGTSEERPARPDEPRHEADGPAERRSRSRG